MNHLRIKNMNLLKQFVVLLMLNNYKIVAYHDDAKRMDVDLCMGEYT